MLCCLRLTLWIIYDLNISLPLSDIIQSRPEIQKCVVRLLEATLSFKLNIRVQNYVIIKSLLVLYWEVLSVISHPLWKLIFILCSFCSGPSQALFVMTSGRSLFLFHPKRFVLTAQMLFIDSQLCARQCHMNFAWIIFHTIELMVLPLIWEHHPHFSGTKFVVEKC